MNKEIGGYFELETFPGEQYHKNAIALNCGRGCIKYLTELREIKKVWIPDFMCDSVPNAFRSMGVEVKTYRINEKFLPEYGFGLRDGEWLFLADYYGQLEKEDIEFAKEYSKGNLIVDETQGFFNEPCEGVDTFYSCRKWFGVANGAFLVTGDGKRLERTLDRDESHNRMLHVLGRYERPASEFYEDAAANNDFFEDEPAKGMSLITENLLRAIDYENVIDIRRKNWNILSEKLADINQLKLKNPHVPFMYPLLVNGADDIRKQLIKEKIYVPVLWPNVIEYMTWDSVAHKFAETILPLPVDQRYSPDDMEYMAEELIEIL